MVAVDGYILAANPTTTQSDLARAGQVTRARLTQIMALTYLAPDIQEHLLHLPRYATGRAPLTEHHLRQIATEPNWDQQRKAYRSIKSELAD